MTHARGEQEPAGPARSLLCLVLILGGLAAVPDPGLARRELLTAEQKEHLRTTARILLDPLVLADRGRVPPDRVTDVVSARLRRLGYAVQTDPGQPHDVTVKVKCEEHKVWEGTGRSGGDADLPGAASRLWKGPACQFNYGLGSRPLGWRHEVRTAFEDTREAAREAGAPDPSAYALAQLTDRLRDDPFPYLLAAEWGQSDRLVPVLDEPETTSEQKVVVITLLGNMAATDAMARLRRALNDPDPAVAEASAVAIGRIGQEDGIPILLDVLAHGKPELHLAAAKGLGRLAPLYPQTDIVPALLDALPREPVPVQTEIVRALGRSQDRRIMEPLRRLNRTVQAESRQRDTPELRELRSALTIVLDQFDGVHTNESGYY